MALDAGSVYATLGGKFNPAGFNQFGSAMNGAAKRAEEAEGRISRSHKRISSSMGLVGISARQLAGGSGLYGVYRAFRYVIGSAADFEKQLSVFKATADATNTQMKAVSATARALGADTRLPATSAKDAADAMTELAKGGLKVSDAMRAARGTLELSAAAQISNAEAAKIVADNLNAFQLRGRQAVRVADLLAASANATTASMPEMAQALQQSAAGAHNLRITLPDTVSLLSELANRGIKGSDAGTSLKQMLISLTPSSKKAAETMKEIGVSAFDAEGRFRGIRPVIKDYHDALLKLTDEQRAAALQTIFGSDATRAASIIFGQGARGLDRMREAVNKHGAAQKLAKSQTEGFSGSMQGLKSTLDTVAIDLGMKMLPTLADGARAFSDFISGMDEGTGAGGRFARGLSENISPILDGIAQGAREAAPLFVTLGQAIGRMAPGLAQVASGMGQAFGGAIRVVGNLASALNNLLHLRIGAAFGDIGAGIGNYFHAMVGAAKVAVGEVRAVFGALGPGITGPFRSAISTVLGLFSSLLSAVSSVVSHLAGIPVIGKAFKGLASGLADAAAGIDDLRHKIEGIKPPRPVKVDVRWQEAQAALNRIQSTGLRNKVLKILGQNTDAHSKIKQIEALGIPHKDAVVLGKVADALSKLASVQGALAAIQSKSVTVTVTTVTNQINRISNIIGSTIAGHAGGHRASGRGPIGAEIALVGEGKGPEYIVNPDHGYSMKVNGPMVMDLQPGDYVVPTEQAYRGRAMGLLAGLMSDLGVTGYKSGRPPKKRPRKGHKGGRWVPGHLDPLRLPVDDLKKAVDHARGDIKDSERLRKDLDTVEASIRDIERRKPKGAAQKANQKDDLARAQRKRKATLRKLRALPEGGDLARLRADWHARQAEYEQGKAYQRQIDDERTLADIAADHMATADRRGDDAAYDAAKSDRGTHLAKLRQLYADALTHIKAGSAYALEIQKQISGVESEQADNDASEASEGPAVTDTGLTPEQAAALAIAQRDVALAALTPGIADDQEAAQRVEAILSQALTTDLARGAAPAVVQSIAEQLATARSNLASFATGGSTVTNDNADTQAQIDQANQRAATAAAEAQAASAALRAFTSSGDIGTGNFGSAYGAAVGGPTIVVQTLHPADPQTLNAIGRAATQGQSMQGASSNPAVAVGL